MKSRTRSSKNARRKSARSRASARPKRTAFVPRVVLSLSCAAVVPAVAGCGPMVILADASDQPDGFADARDRPDRFSVADVFGSVADLGFIPDTFAVADLGFIRDASVADTGFRPDATDAFSVADTGFRPDATDAFSVADTGFGPDGADGAG